MTHSMSWLVAWASAFLFTQAVEIPIYFHAIRSSRPDRWRALAIAAGASAISHPLLWFVGWPFVRGLYLSAIAADPRWVIVDASWRYSLMLLPLELCVVSIEAVYLRKLVPLQRRQAVAWSLLANAASLALGTGLRIWLDGP